MREENQVAISNEEYDSLLRAHRKVAVTLKDWETEVPYPKVAIRRNLADEIIVRVSAEFVGTFSNNVHFLTLDKSKEPNIKGLYSFEQAQRIADEVLEAHGFKFLVI